MEAPKKTKKTKEKTGPIYLITDPEEWERLLREVPLQSGEIRFYRGPKKLTRW